MARIRKEDHARILALVDVERRAVREIAADYGCTPAAIYALLTKLRQAAKAVMEPAGTQPPLALDPAPDPAPAPAPLVKPVAVPPRKMEAETARKVVSFERVAPPVPRQAPSVGPRLAKSGMGLAMRTPDGEETMTPFRSIDDLLSAIKPILRAGARSAEPVWFSLQPIDLAAFEVDAA